MYNFGQGGLAGRKNNFWKSLRRLLIKKIMNGWLREFNSNYYYIERNANPKILFMDLMLKTNELINIK